MPGGTVVVTVSLGEPETGSWCPECLLPSAARWPMLLGGHRVLPDIEVCQDCGWHVPVTR